jgi:HPr kinase/phosphorylase
MSTALTARSVFEAMKAGLELEWVAGRSGGDRLLQGEGDEGEPAALIGHLNLIHPNRIQVIGETEARYLERLHEESLADAYAGLLGEETAFVLVAENQAIAPQLADGADRRGVPIIRSPRPSHELISVLRYFFSNRLAEKTTVHGVFMEVMGIGVLLTGDSNVGKSELALELITRGHRLIADDSPELARIAPDILSGSCPPLLQDFLEVRGLGVLNVRAMYGDNAIKDSKYLRLIIHLHEFPEASEDSDRLQGTLRSRNILGVEVSEITLPVAPGRNLAVLVEAAVRNHLLRLNGYNAGSDLAAKQQRMILQQP